MAGGIIISLLLHMAKGAVHEFGRKFGESSVKSLVPHEPSAAAQYRTLMQKFAQQQINQQEMSKQLLDILGAWQAQAAKNKVDELKLIWDKDNWFSKLDRQETMQMLGQTRHRLLILAACPDISPDCPESFRNNLKTEVRNSAGAFLSQHYPAASETCPVEFYGDYFKTPISEIDARRLQSVLSAAPTAALFSEITDYQAHFHVVFWGLNAAQVTHCPLPVWNWEETYHALLSEGMDEKTAQRRIRQIIAQQHQLLAAYVADWYYLHLNPAYQPQLFDLSAMFGDGAAAWAQPYSESLRGMYAAQQRALAEAAERERQEEERQRQEAERDRYSKEAERKRQEEARKRKEEEQGTEFSFETVTVDSYGKIVSREHRTARQKLIDLGKGIVLEIVYIPNGTFKMGSPVSENDHFNDEEPQHQVTIKSFYMGKYPVTQAQWHTVIGSNSSHFKDANLPIDRVSWDEAQEFLLKLNTLASVRASFITPLQFRLPSEAEWEYACRAGTTTPFYFGETITPEIANYYGKSKYNNGPKGVYRDKKTDVGSFPPNAFGLYDMHGNVWERCADPYHKNYNDAPTDSSVWKAGTDKVDKSVGYVLRGGYYRGYAYDCRSARRGQIIPDLWYSFIGFRVAASLT